MATTYSLKIVDGSQSAISLTNTGSTGFIGAQGGFGPTRIPADLLMGGKIAETYVIDLKGSSHDNAATQIQAFVKMLKAAKDYHETEWQPAPVYIEVQTSGETNPRYAMIYTAVELEMPDLFDVMFQTNHLIEDFKLTIIREHPWRSAVPMVEGTAITLGASDGPADPTKVAVANFRDDITVDKFKRYDHSTTTHTNISAGDAIAVAPVTQYDGVYIGSTVGPFKHAVIPILSVKGVITTSDIRLNYWNGASSTELVLGTDYTCYPGPTLEACFEQDTEDIVISIVPPADWAVRDLGDGNAWYIYFQDYHATPAWGTIPVLHATNDIYAQKSNYVEVPAASLKGDAPPLSIIRLFAPAGGDEIVGPANISRILIGAKSEHGGVSLASFEPFINLGNVDNPAGWSVSYGTDTSSVADTQAPGNARAAVTFATDATMVARATVLGDNLLDD